MKTNNLNNYLINKYGLNLTKEGLEKIAKIVISENSEPLVCKGEIKEKKPQRGKCIYFRK